MKKISRLKARKEEEKHADVIKEIDALFVDSDDGRNKPKPGR